MKTRDIGVCTMVYGVLWNALGWIRNNLVLGDAWDAVNSSATPGFSPPYAGLTREAMTLVPDFLYAFGFVWVFAQMRTQTVMSAVVLGLLLEVFVVITYLALVTSGFLPWTIAVQSGHVAMVIFLATTPLLPIVLRPRLHVADSGE